MVLSTQPTMRDAHRLYERLGFSRQPHRDWQSSTSRRSMLVYSLALWQWAEQEPKATED